MNSEALTNTLKKIIQVSNNIKPLLFLFALLVSVGVKGQNLTIAKVYSDTSIFTSNTFSPIRSTNYYGCKDSTNICFFAIKTLGSGNIFLNLRAAVTASLKVGAWGPFDCVDNLIYDSLTISKYIFCDSLKINNWGDTTKIYNAIANQYYVFRYQDITSSIDLIITIFNDFTTATISSNYSNDCNPTAINALSTAHNTLTIFPNPATNQLTVSSNQLSGKETTIKMYNVLGEEVKTFKLLPQSSINTPNNTSLINLTTFDLDVSQLANGVYTLITNNSKLITQNKVVISK